MPPGGDPWRCDPASTGLDAALGIRTSPDQCARLCVRRWGDGRPPNGERPHVIDTLQAGQARRDPSRQRPRRRRDRRRQMRRDGRPRHSGQPLRRSAQPDLSGVEVGAATAAVHRRLRRGRHAFGRGPGRGARCAWPASAIDHYQQRAYGLIPAQRHVRRRPRVLLLQSTGVAIEASVLSIIGLLEEVEHLAPWHLIPIP